ncbi:N-acetyltransferase [Enterococcus hermanniensis]|uniref:N-acetyltransferase n=2 Tax=Enterococcus hermanniensis TaxID=249189 RepID=A0A1L8TQ29_9ENTE|nr:N-acetyltransferase [Enterococcus hermanniensis]
MLLGWGKIYTDIEVVRWYNRVQKEYNSNGYSYYIVEKKHLNQPVGIAGLLKTTINEREYTEIAYIIKKEFQGHGYATLISKQLIDLAFNKFKLTQVIAQSNPKNLASQKIIQNIGMTYEFSYLRQQNKQYVKHWVYSIKASSNASKD